MVCHWEMAKIKDWTTDEIRNRIWNYVTNGQPIPGCVSVTALRVELLNRGEEPKGFHDT